MSDTDQDDLSGLFEEPGETPTPQDEPREEASDGAEAQDHETEEASEDRSNRRQTANERIQGLIQERNDWKQQVDEARYQNQRMEERFQQLMERMTPQEQVPNYEDDPAAYILHQQEQLRRQNEYILANQQQNEQQRAQHQQIEQIKSAFTTSESQFSQQYPDYQAKVKVLADQRLKSWIDTGLDPLAAQQMLQNEVMSVAATAIANGRDPAQIFYQMAEHITLPSVETETGSPQSQRQGAPARAPSSIGTRGNGGKGKVTLADVANMSEAEFAKFMDAGGEDALYDLHSAEGVV